MTTISLLCTKEARGPIQTQITLREGVGETAERLRKISLPEVYSPRFNLQCHHKLDLSRALENTDRHKLRRAWPNYQGPAHAEDGGLEGPGTHELSKAGSTAKRADLNISRNKAERDEEEVSDKSRWVRVAAASQDHILGHYLQMTPEGAQRATWSHYCGSLQASVQSRKQV